MENFELERLADLAQINRDPDVFFRLNPRAVALDEGQRLPAQFPALRVAIDSDRDRLGRYAFTGSSSPDLNRAISESLADRVAILELSPFSSAEAYAQPPSAFLTLLTGRRAPCDFLELPLRIAVVPAPRHAGSITLRTRATISPLVASSIVST